MSLPVIAQDDAPTGPGYAAGFALGDQLAHWHARGDTAELEQACLGLRDALEQSGLYLDDFGPCTGSMAADANAGHLARFTSTARRKSGDSDSSSRGFSVQDDYAELNARREGVVVLPSSVQYEVLQPGRGEPPAAADTVMVNYQASLPDGSIFDTTYDSGNPLRLKLDEIAIPGLREALLRMPMGSRWRVVIPPRMGFGRSGNNRLRRRDVIFEIELVAIERS